MLSLYFSSAKMRQVSEFCFLTISFTIFRSEGLNVGIILGLLLQIHLALPMNSAIELNSTLLLIVLHQKGPGIHAHVGQQCY